MLSESSAGVVWWWNVDGDTVFAAIVRVVVPSTPGVCAAGGFGVRHASGCVPARGVLVIFMVGESFCILFL